MPEPRFALWKSRALRLWLTAGTSALGVLGSLVRNKWLALHLDPAGIGVLGQVVSAQTWMGTLTGLALAVPVARAIGAALARDDADAVRRAVSTALRMVTASAIVVAAAGLLGAAWVSTALFGTAEHATLVRISMIAVVGLAYQAVLSGTFAGHSDVRAPFSYALAGNLAMVALVLLVVPRFGLAGAVWGIGAFWPAAIACVLIAHRHAYAGAFAAPAAGPRFDRREGAVMLKIALAGLMLTLADQGAILALRAHYVRVAGLAANGLLQASLGLSQQFGNVVYAYLASYAFGRISGQPDAAGVREYTRRQWTPLVGLALLGCATVTLLARPLLHLLYSDRFEAAGPMLAWMLIGEFGRMGVQVWALGALPLGGVRLWVSIGIATVASMAIGYAVAAAAGAGAMALPYAYAACGVVSLAFTGTVMSARGVTLRPRHLALLVAGFAVLAAIALAAIR